MQCAFLWGGYNIGFCWLAGVACCGRGWWYCAPLVICRFGLDYVLGLGFWIWLDGYVAGLFWDGWYDFVVLIAFGLGVRVGCVLGLPVGLRNTGFLG